MKIMPKPIFILATLAICQLATSAPIPDEARLQKRLHPWVVPTALAAGGAFVLAKYVFPPYTFFKLAD